MSEKMATMVVDLGFSSAKYMFNGIKGRVSSAFRSGAGGYLFGDDALIRTGSSYLKTPEELVRHYPAFVTVCMEKAGVSPDIKIKLVIGLPYLFWKMEYRNGGVVETLAKTLKRDNVVDVSVLPQGLCGVADYLDSSPDSNGNILAIDIGFNSVVFALFNVLENNIIHINSYYKRGIHQMAVDHVLPRIAHLAPARTYTPLETSILIERGVLQYGFKAFDIHEEVHQAAKEYVKAIFDDIFGELQFKLDTTEVADKIILFGGGAALLEKLIQVSIPFEILDEPEYANARGFHILSHRE
jgi:plasmid segregation protein ParM